MDREYFNGEVAIEKMKSGAMCRRKSFDESFKMITGRKDGHLYVYISEKSPLYSRFSAKWRKVLLSEDDEKAADWYEIAKDSRRYNVFI